MVHTQQMRYSEAMPDIMNYATNALSAIAYVEPNINANKYVVYPQLFDEFNAFRRRNIFPILYLLVLY
jgi:hypothetical protein